jgi:hypothetical protein
MKGSLGLDLSKEAHHRITWASIYNVVAVLLAAGAFVDAMIPPQYARLGELLSVFANYLCCRAAKASQGRLGLVRAVLQACMVGG